MSAAADIRAAFEQHFAGEAPVYVPTTRMNGNREYEVGMLAVDAIESVADYPECLRAYHAMLRGAVTLEQYREALIAEFVDMHAVDVDAVREEVTA